MRAMTAQTSLPDEGAAARGFVFAFLAYLIWGLQPLFLKAVAHVPTIEILAHRVLWSVPVAGAVLFALGRTGDLKIALRSPRTLLMAALTALLISVNWGIYVWAIAVDRVLETSLGYYINPLMSVIMGAALLGEKLTRAQYAAIGLAVLAVVLLTVEAGGLPWVSLVLAASFAVYGYLRKTLPIGPSQGFFLEVVLLLPLALGYIIWLAARGEGHFGPTQPLDMALLVLAGPVTAAPLLFFGFGARLLRLSTIGLMQYMAPTIVFLLAVFVFGEPFGAGRALAFGLIWTALAIYTWSMVRGRR